VTPAWRPQVMRNAGTWRLQLPLVFPRLPGLIPASGIAFQHLSRPLAHHISGLPKPLRFAQLAPLHLGAIQTGESPLSRKSSGLDRLQISRGALTADPTVRTEQALLPEF
jgi:hypothetical protein